MAKKKTSKKKTARKSTVKKTGVKKVLAKKTTKKVAAKMGAPTKYRKELDQVVYGYALLGATDKMMAELMGVTEKTLNNWKHAHPDFLQSITRGKAPVDVRVAKALLERASGYEHPEEKIFCHEGKITRTSTTRHYPPDTAAASLWLRNRQPKLWRDKQEIVLLDEDDDFIPTKDLLMKQIELKKKIKALEAQL